MKRQLPSQTLEEQFLSPATRNAPLSENIRLGAQLMLPRFMSERSGLSLMFAVLVDASAAWRGVKITPATSQELEASRTSAKAQVANRLAA